MFGGLESIIIILIVFLVCRELVTWYWKQNAILAELKFIRDELRVANGKKPLGSVNQGIVGDVVRSAKQNTDKEKSFGVNLDSVWDDKSDSHKS